MSEPTLSEKRTTDTDINANAVADQSQVLVALNIVEPIRPKRTLPKLRPCAVVAPADETACMATPIASEKHVTSVAEPEAPIFDDARYLDMIGAMLFESVTFPHHAETTCRYKSPDIIMKHYETLLQTIKELFSVNSFIAVRVSDDDIGYFEFLVSGPINTPYHNGLFHFRAILPSDYPHNPPHVEILSTHNGTLRPNPNLYESGKVCLSLLGTWRGPEKINKWQPGISNLSQVVIAIQSQILVGKPLLNEPGYENRSTYHDIMGYNSYVNYVSTQVAYDLFCSPPEAFADVIRSHMLLKTDIWAKQLISWCRMAGLRPPTMPVVYVCSYTYGHIALALRSIGDKLLEKLRA